MLRRPLGAVGAGPVPVDRGFRLGLALVVAALLCASPALVGPFASAAGSDRGAAVPGHVAPPGAPTPIPVSYETVGAPRALPGSFWGVDANGANAIGAPAASALLATPARYVVWPSDGLGDRFDVLNNTLWTDGVVTNVHSTSEVQFVNWCRSTHCAAILQVPGEIDNATIAAEVVNYTLNTLHFAPAYWEIGNEPALWTHWKEMWWNWKTGDRNFTSPIGYADEVQQYIAAMRTVNASLPILGLPGVGTGALNETAWINATVAVNGPNLAGVAIHVYPAGNPDGNSVPLAQFNSYLTSRSSLPARVPADLGAIASACSGCASLPSLFVTEFNSATNTSPYGYTGYVRYLDGFANVPFVTAEVIQALNLSLANLDYFSLQSVNFPGSWLNATGAATPSFTLYSTLLDRLGPDVQPIAPTTPGPPGLYAALTVDPNDSARSFLVANANTTAAASLNLSALGFPSGQGAEIWTWNNTTSLPVATYSPLGAPTNLSIAAESVALVETSNYSVTFTESGLPSGTSWSVTFNGTANSSSQASIDFSVVPDAYHYTVGEVPGYTATPLDGTVGVEDTNLTIPIVWSPTLYRVTLAESGLPRGTSWSVTLDGNSSHATTSSISFEIPNGTYTASIANVSGFVANVTEVPVAVQGSNQTVEVGWVAFDFRVTFTSTGLPVGTSWSVDLNGTILSSATGTIAFAEPNGTYTAKIPGVPGFRPNETSERFAVANSSVNVPISWSPVEYLVSFLETGLPAGTPWSVAIDGVSHNSTGTIGFEEPNGTYSIRVEPVAGYSSSLNAFSLTVAGNDTDRLVIWTPPPTYSVEFVEEGLAANTLWAVTFNGSEQQSTGPEIAFSAGNGTYNFSVAGVAGYAIAPLPGQLTVSGSNVTETIPFSSTAGHPAATAGPAPSNLLYTELVGIALVVVGATVLGLWWWRSRRPPSAATRPEWSEEP